MPNAITTYTSEWRRNQDQGCCQYFPSSSAITSTALAAARQFFFSNLQDGQEGLLRNFDAADLLHALLCRFLLSSSLRLRVTSP